MGKKTSLIVLKVKQWRLKTKKHAMHASCKDIISNHRVLKKRIHFWRNNLISNITHSVLIRNLIKLKGTAKLTAQDEQVCLKDSKYILFEILENRTLNMEQAPAGRASQIAKSGLLGWQELVLPFHVLFARISNKTYLESLRHTRSPCSVSFAVPFNFIRFLISALWNNYRIDSYRTPLEFLNQYHFSHHLSV